MSVVTRFAPSPTGRLHVGNLRTAVLAWAAARGGGGRFLLRIDDTDAARSREEHVVAIRDDLARLGLVPDGEVRQSDRFAAYDARFAELVEGGHVYPAYETPQELDLRRKVQLGRGLPPIYDRAALSLTAAEVAAFEAEGRRPHWRFRLPDGALGWDDAIRGPVRFEAAALSDPVVRRADGSWLYLLPSVIDDIAMGVSDVVRGEDHVTNTAAQLAMFAALGAAPPRFAHAALLTGTEGKLSKRLGSLGLDELAAEGIEPAAVVAFLARIGTSRPVEPLDAGAVVAGFDFADFGRAPARFDLDELAALNARVVHDLPHAAVADRLPEGMDAAAWAAVRANVASVAQAADWWGVIAGAVTPPDLSAEDRAYLAAAAGAVAASPWGDDPWHALTAALGAQTGRRGRALFLPLRRALTGRDAGPDMAALLPLIGRTRAIARLTAAAQGDD